MSTSADELKKLTRTKLLARRQEMTEMARQQAGAALAMHAMSWQPLMSAKRVACYLSAVDEPDTSELLEVLAARQIEVLLPVVRPGRTLDWVMAGGPERAGKWGLREPVGPLLGPDAIHSCDIAFIPALAVDHAGYRLGRGGGFYDRALADFTGVRCAVVFTEELVESLPTEAHDEPVDVALSPGGIFRVL